MNWKSLIIFAGMAAFVLLSIFAFTSCGTFTRVEPNGATTVQAGFLSSIQGVVVQVKPGRNGTAPTVTFSQTGYDGTSIANNGIAAIPVVEASKAALGTIQSNNLASVKKAGITSKTELGKQKLANDAAAQADAAAAKKLARANGAPAKVLTGG